jgi:hypothetical protein
MNETPQAKESLKPVPRRLGLRRNPKVIKSILICGIAAALLVSPFKGPEKQPVTKRVRAHDDIPVGNKLIRKRIALPQQNGGS